MKLTIPENQSDITLGNYQAYELGLADVKTDKEAIDNALVNIIGIDKDDVGKLNQQDREDISTNIFKALEVEGGFKQRFKLNGVEYGLIPNFMKHKVSGDEYNDMCIYKGDTVSLHRLMAILYRPITKKDKHGNYQITPYKGSSELCEEMRSMPLSIVTSCLGFFLRLREELLRHIQKYTEAERMKEVE